AGRGGDVHGADGREGQQRVVDGQQRRAAVGDRIEEVDVLALVAVRELRRVDGGLLAGAVAVGLVAAALHAHRGGGAVLDVDVLQRVGVDDGRALGSLDLQADGETGVAGGGGVQHGQGAGFEGEGRNDRVLDLDALV